MIYTEPTAGGTRNPIDESIWSQLWSNYSYGVVHNDDVSIEIKREEHAGAFKTILRGAISGVKKNQGQALRQFHRVLVDKHGTDATPIDNSIEISDYDAFYRKLIFGGRAAGAAKYASKIGVEEAGGFNGLILSANNMEWWVLGTQRPGYGQQEAGFDKDYKLLNYQDFNSKAFVQQKIDKNLIGWPVKASGPESSLVDLITSSSNFTLANSDIAFSCPQIGIQLVVNEYKGLPEMADLATALGTFTIRSLSSNSMPSDVSGGTWSIETVESGIQLNVQLKLQVVDDYNWEAGAWFELPVPDGESPNPISIPDDWALYYETLEGNYLGGQAKSFPMGTKYEWELIEVIIPLKLVNGNLELESQPTVEQN
jgi:hypothetical protein